MRVTHPILLALLVMGTATEVESQLTKRIGESIKQRIDQRKKEVEDSLVKRAADPADSLIHRVKRPVDSATSRAGAAAGSAVANAGRGSGSARSPEEQRILKGLESGSVELPAVQFEPGKAEVLAASQGAMLDLVKVLMNESGAFLIRARGDAGTPAAKSRALGTQRATALKMWLVANGVPADRLFTAADETAGVVVASLLRIQ